MLQAHAAHRSSSSNWSIRSSSVLIPIPAQPRHAPSLIVAQGFSLLWLEQVNLVHHAQSGLLLGFQFFEHHSTCASCSAESGLLASETCNISAARCTSSSVARNADTSVCGRLRMNPTVSDSKTLRLRRQLHCREWWDRAWRTSATTPALRLRQRIEQRGFARVGVAHQRNRRHRHRLAALTLLRANAAHVFDLLFTCRMRR